ncbi:hypothetical protein JOB18_026194, partial [Solea senegalensis]
MVIRKTVTAVSAVDTRDISATIDYRIAEKRLTDPTTCGHVHALTETRRSGPVKGQDKRVKTVDRMERRHHSMCSYHMPKEERNEQLVQKKNHNTRAIVFGLGSESLQQVWDQPSCYYWPSLFHY